MKLRDAARGEGDQLLVLGRGLDDEGREKLLEDVPVLLKQKPEELGRVVGDQVDLDAIADAGLLDGLLRRVQAEDLARRQDVAAAEVIVGVG